MPMTIGIHDSLIGISECAIEIVTIALERAVRLSLNWMTLPKHVHARTVVHSDRATLHEATGQTMPSRLASAWPVAVTRA